MPQTSDAEEHLRIIRSLMEKATVYRAISSQAALIGGLLAILAGVFLAGANDLFVRTLVALQVHPSNAEIYGFQLKWAVVLVICIASNLHFLRRDARRRQEAFFSPGMRLALRAMVPALFSATVITTLWSREILPQFWMVFYGLAVLSTAHFAPTSLVRLGWAFLLTGLVLFLFNGAAMVGRMEQVVLPDHTPKAPLNWTYTDAVMAAVFGGYHLIYAACTSRRAVVSETPAAV